AGQEFGKPTPVAAFAVVLAARDWAERRWARAPRRRTGDIARGRLLRSGAVGTHWSCLRAPAARGVKRLDIAAHGLNSIQRPPMASDNPIEFGERFDLIDDHAAHLGCALGRLLRQLKDAAAQLLTRRLEFLLHLRRHLLHALHDFTKPRSGFGEH